MARNTFAPMASDTYYPSTSGVRIGLLSSLQTIYPPRLADVDMLIGGTLGTGSPTLVLEVQTEGGDWIPATGLSLTATGQVSGRIEGNAVRINAALGSTPGTGANIPCYHLNVRPVDGGIASKGSTDFNA